MKKLEVVIPIVIGLGLFILLYNSGLLSVERSLTTLAEKYLEYIPDASSIYTSMAFEVVTAVIWDQRGFDTYFETSVLFFAIIATLAIASKLEDIIGERRSLTIIVRLVTRILAPIIVVVSISIALHGHITPGGGFQGGAVFVIAPLLLMLAYTSDWIRSRGFTDRKLLLLRGLGVTLIALAGLIPVVYSYTTNINAYLFQNQAKPDSFFNYPAYLQTPISTILVSGTIMLLNILEFIAVLTGFTLAF